ncbi:MAG: hypothetical protein L3J51_03665 [Cocleimonas sp.]|nr:hypothetical protein [Cocleimonas sp.]
MHNIKKSFLISMFMLLTACGGSLQAGRMDNAEGHFILAERAISASNVRVANDSLGTAKAFLATVNDFKKSLNIHELRRFEALKKREAKVERTIKGMR